LLRSKLFLTPSTSLPLLRKYC